MTLRNAPLSGRDARSNAPDLPDGLSEIFLQTGLDSSKSNGRTDLPDGQNATPEPGPERIVRPADVPISGSIIVAKYDRVCDAL
jgi:hypothetical protein